MAPGPIFVCTIRAVLRTKTTSRNQNSCRQYKNGNSAFLIKIDTSISELQCGSRVTCKYNKPLTSKHIVHIHPKSLHLHVDWVRYIGTVSTLDYTASAMIAHCLRKANILRTEFNKLVLFSPLNLFPMSNSKSMPW